MKKTIVKFLCWILRKMNVSVIINFKVENGTIQGKTFDCFYYDNDFVDCNVLDQNNELIEIPHKTAFDFQIPTK